MTGRARRGETNRGEQSVRQTPYHHDCLLCSSQLLGTAPGDRTRAQAVSWSEHHRYGGGLFGQVCLEVMLVGHLPVITGYFRPLQSITGYRWSLLFIVGQYRSLLVIVGYW